jgi:nucleoside-diphosphate-sugar epimerase
MRVFITGANGFIGSAAVRELLDSGHQVVGLVRSDTAAAAVGQAGGEVLRGSIEDLETLTRGAEGADGVIHTAYIHDFAQPPEVAAQADRRAIETLAAALEGSARPLVITSATGLLGPGYVATEDDRPHVTERSHPRAASDLLALELASRGNNLSIVRPATSVHGEGDHAFIPALIEIARNKGVSAYVGDGSNRWPAVHRLDAARLYRLALEHGTAGSVFHAVAEEGVPTRDIAEAIGRQLKLPVVSIVPDDADEHFGWIGMFCAADIPASSVQTRERLGWEPARPGLIADLEAGYYFAHETAAR